MISLEYLLENPNKYELLISDYRMPNLNEREFGAKVKKLNRDIKVILIYPYDNIEDNNMTLNHSYLLKYNNCLIGLMPVFKHNDTRHYYQQEIDKNFYNKLKKYKSISYYLKYIFICLKKVHYYFLESYF